MAFSSWSFGDTKRMAPERTDSAWLNTLSDFGTEVGSKNTEIMCKQGIVETLQYLDVQGIPCSLAVEVMSAMIWVDTLPSRQLRLGRALKAATI